MFNQEIHRVGFACKIQESEGKVLPHLNTKGTTITWLSGQSKARAVERLWELMRTNIAALHAQVEYVSKLPPKLRMFRISSDLLTAYTHDDWMWFYFEPDVLQFLETNLARTGALARANDVRLSFHPGQFCVLASDRPDVVENSITEFEYHCDIIRYMGFGREFQDFKCNVHVGGKAGPAGIKAVMKKLSREARNCLTIENAEFSWGLDASLELVDTCALVLDIHHHNIHSSEYIQPNDDRFKSIIESWRGVRPVIHYSVSREDIVSDYCSANDLPDINFLVSKGVTKAKLRAHSDYYWNNAVNTWAASFSPYADIMCEAKEKNLARDMFCQMVGL